MIPIKVKLAFGLLISIALVMLSIVAARGLPATSATFTSHEGALTAHYDGKSYVLSRFLIGTDSIAASNYFVIEEPDTLPTYDDMNRLFQQSTRLSQALKNKQLSMESVSGELIQLAPKQRHIADLPGLFWLQIICGLAGMVVCLLAWVPAKNSIAILAFTGTGVGYFLASVSAAIYSTRELFIDGDLFQALSTINHIGTMMFATSLALFLWNYPVKNASRGWNWLILLTLPVGLSCDLLQLDESIALSFYALILVMLLLSLTGLYVQWRRTSHAPADRLALRWILLSVIFGTFVFAGAIILPIVFKFADPAPQGVILATFLMMYAGMMLAIVRYRLFDLELWSFSIWAWVLGGLAVLVMDMILASALSFSDPAALTTALALVGWLYFPVRQLIWRYFFDRRSSGLEEWMAQSLPVMLAAHRVGDGDQAIQLALGSIFSPLASGLEAAAATEMAIKENGESLLVPLPDSQYVLRLSNADQGRRLFSRKDLKIAKLVIDLNEILHESVVAKAAGAQQERQRIRQDLHDDLGAKLLTLLHRSDEQTRPVVKEAIADLRTILSKQVAAGIGLKDACHQWHDEAALRCAERGVELHWHCVEKDALLTPDEYGHLSRMLRESLTNAIKHADPSAITIKLCADEELRIEIVNDGVDAGRAMTAGNGSENLRQRAIELAGECQQWQENGLWYVLISVKITDLTRV